MESNSIPLPLTVGDNPVATPSPDSSEIRTKPFPTLYIIVESFVCPETLAPILGGTETYTSALITLAVRYGSRAYVFQKSISPLQVKLSNGVVVESWHEVALLRRRLADLRTDEPGILVFYGYPFAPDKTELPCVIIQHGVGADGTVDPQNRPKWLVKLADIRRRLLYLRRVRNELRKYSSASRVLCVDTNFINQMRANHPMFDWSSHLIYIPNFADISTRRVVEAKWNDNKGRIVVLFARRFVIQRGTYLWADCVKELAHRFPDTEFRFVGSGDGQDHLDVLAQQFPNVCIYSRPYREMQREHEEAHIEVVPSLWSEGTSLSCIESMAAGCATVCSDVGGLGNLVLPDYNGLIVSPRADAFVDAVSELLTDSHKAEALGMRAYDTAKIAFSRAAWEKRVTTLFDEVCAKPSALPLSRRIKSSRPTPREQVGSAS